MPKTLMYVDNVGMKYLIFVYLVVYSTSNHLHKVMINICLTYDELGGRNSNVVGTWTTFLIKNVAKTDLEAGTLGGIIITRVLSLHFGFHPLKVFSKE